MERILRGIAGFVVLASVLLIWRTGEIDVTKPTWLWLTAFVGANLLQSAFSNWCPMMWLLQKFGVRPSAAA
jgi:hypothetical protein